jgi:hypothetical protein
LLRRRASDHGLRLAGGGGFVLWSPPLAEISGSGGASAGGLLHDVTSAEDALCPDPRAAAWHTLAALRGRESMNELLAARRRLEYGQPLAPVLSELLLERWRAGDWTVMPQDLLARL